MAPLPQPPLAEQLRPKDLDGFVGQVHLVGPGKPLRKLYEQGGLHSMIFWGPPGVGKTTLARILAEHSGLPIAFLSAIDSGVKDLRAVMERAEKEGRTVLFVDEIHRFNKSQQDALLGAVERGTIILIGATTENPSFEVNRALLSRCRIYTLKELSLAELQTVLSNGLQHLAAPDLLDDEGEKELIHLSGGDARKLLNLVEAVAAQHPVEKHLGAKEVGQVAQAQARAYDKTGEQHYDIISAFIKSVRGSEPDSAVYWLARMIEGGEEPRFIARRLLILAAEDIGLANPNALLLANATFDAVDKIGWPESRIILSECTVYLATSEKSNSAYMAINQAQAEVSASGDLQVPMPIRNAPTKLMKELGYGKGYQYPHDYPGNFTQQQYLPAEIENKVFYNPGDNARERPVRKDLQQKWPNKKL